MSDLQWEDVCATVNDRIEREEQQYGSRHGLRNVFCFHVGSAFCFGHNPVRVADILEAAFGALWLGALSPPTLPEGLARVIEGDRNVGPDEIPRIHLALDVVAGLTDGVIVRWNADDVPVQGTTYLVPGTEVDYATIFRDVTFLGGRENEAVVHHLLAYAIGYDIALNRTRLRGLDVEGILHDA